MVCTSATSFDLISSARIRRYISSWGRQHFFCPGTFKAPPLARQWRDYIYLRAFVIGLFWQNLFTPGFFQQFKLDQWHSPAFSPIAFQILLKAFFLKSARRQNQDESLYISSTFNINKVDNPSGEATSFLHYPHKHCAIYLGIRRFQNNLHFRTWQRQGTRVTCNGENAKELRCSQNFNL